MSYSDDSHVDRLEEENAELRELVSQAIAKKPEKHGFDKERGQIDNREIKNMNSIGG